MRSDENKAKIPSKTFSAFLPQIRQDLIGSGLRGGPYQLIARAICDFNDLNKEVAIGDDTYHEGWTRFVSYSEIAEAADKCRRTVITAISAMVDAGILEKEQDAPRTRNRFRFTAYDKLHAQIESDPSIVQETHAYRFEPAATSESDAHPSAKNAHSLEFKEFKGPPPTISGTAAARAVPMPKAKGGELKNSQKQKTKTPAAAPGPGVECKKDLAKDNNADLFLSQPSEAPTESAGNKPVQNPERQQPSPSLPVTQPQSKVSNSAALPAAAPRDIVPNAYIGEVVDKLTDEKTMASNVHEDHLEEFMEVFKANKGVVWQWRDTQAARLLKETLTGVLDTASIAMPPLLFFKHCVKEMENQIADGKIAPRPDSFKFFLNAKTGKEIVEYCLDKLKSENRAKNDKARTDALLQEQEQLRSSPRKIPPAAQAELDRLLGRT